MRAIDSRLARTRTPVAVFAAGLGLLLAFAGCENNPSEVEDYVPEPMLTAFIENGAPVDTIYLEWAGRFGDYYDRSELGVKDAGLVMFPVRDGGGEPVDTSADSSLVLRFHPDPAEPNSGVYLPDRDDYLPRGKWTYRIEATQQDQGVDLWAETTVPDTFSYYAAFKSDPFTPVAIDSITLTREADEIFVNWSESATARGFILGIIAETPRDELIPLDPEWDPNDPDDELEDEEKDRHGWTFARYDQRSMTVAWIFFQWAGWNRLYINAASESYYMYMFSVIMRGDPNFTENPLFNVHGGLGVFGAYARHGFDIYLERSGSGG
ncbi:MAG: hypothetical protein MAG453_01038 [Calditrichaeota bacterium]|nr:hypothetical protein [Calditrichota bacterium]